MTAADPLASSPAATAQIGARREEEEELRGEICRKIESERKEAQMTRELELLLLLLLMLWRDADRTRARAAPERRALDHFGRHSPCSTVESAHTGQASSRQDAQAE